MRLDRPDDHQRLEVVVGEELLHLSGVDAHQRSGLEVEPLEVDLVLPRALGAQHELMKPDALATRHFVVSLSLHQIGAPDHLDGQRRRSTLGGEFDLDGSFVWSPTCHPINSTARSPRLSWRCPETTTGCPDATGSDTVAVFGRMDGRLTGSGEMTGAFTFALRAKVRDGQLVLWNWLEDSYAVSKAFHG